MTFNAIDVAKKRLETACNRAEETLILLQGTKGSNIQQEAWVHNLATGLAETIDAICARTVQAAAEVDRVLITSAADSIDNATGQGRR